jgi:uncharacterized protein (TIGR02466 family)
MAQDIESIFVTPLMSRQLPIATPDFLQRLRGFILEMERSERGLAVSNAGGGWHSKGDFFERPVPEVVALRDAVLAASADMTRNVLSAELQRARIDAVFYGGSWANVSRDGAYNKVHNHPGAVWSGVVYIDMGDPEPEPKDNACIEFVDPRPANVHTNKIQIRPVPGLLLMFPAWLQHYVNPYKGKGTRISIAFNVNVEVRP